MHNHVSSFIICARSVCGEENKVTKECVLDFTSKQGKKYMQLIEWFRRDANIYWILYLVQYLVNILHRHRKPYITRNWRRKKKVNKLI